MLIIETYAYLLKRIENIKNLILLFGQDVEEVTFRNGSTEELNVLQKELKTLETTLNNFEKIETKLSVQIYELEGLPYQIARLKILQGMNYKEIAAELGYQYSYIRKFAAESKKKKQFQ